MMSRARLERRLFRSLLTLARKVDPPRKQFFLWEISLAEKGSRRRFRQEFEAETVKLAKGEPAV